MPSPRVGLYDADIFREHDPGAGHPERAQRLDAVREGIRDAGLEDRLSFVAPREATADELRRVHTPEHVAHIAASRGQTVRFDPDTVASPQSCDAALRAAGAVVDAVDRVLDGRLDRAFCAVRPPGHHAERDRAMGFCLFNNVAVAAAHALDRGLQRVLVIDFDVHHGNGTQHIFYDDPRVLYVSSHAFPFYPGTGGVDEVGTGKGRGFNVNLPLPSGLGDGDYARLYRELVLPIARSYHPQLVLVSAGFDPYAGDPIAPMAVTEAGFAEITDVCLQAAAGAAGGKAVFALEGGYNLEGIARSSAAVTRLLLGDSHAPLAVRAPRMDRLIEAIRDALDPYWPVLRG